MSESGTHAQSAGAQGESHAAAQRETDTAQLAEIEAATELAVREQAASHLAPGAVPLLPDPSIAAAQRAAADRASVEEAHRAPQAHAAQLTSPSFTQRRMHDEEDEHADASRALSPEARTHARAADVPVSSFLARDSLTPAPDEVEDSP